MSPTALKLLRAQRYWGPERFHNGSRVYYGNSISAKPGVAMRMIRAAKRDGRRNIINWL